MNRQHQKGHEVSLLDKTITASLGTMNLIAAFGLILYDDMAPTHMRQTSGFKNITSKKKH